MGDDDGGQHAQDADGDGVLDQLFPIQLLEHRRPGDDQVGADHPVVDLQAGDGRDQLLRAEEEDAVEQQEEEEIQGSG